MKLVTSMTIIIGVTLIWLWILPVHTITFHPCVHVSLFVYSISYLFIYLAHAKQRCVCCSWSTMSLTYRDMKMWTSVPCFDSINGAKCCSIGWWRKAFQPFGNKCYSLTKDGFSYCIQSNHIICYYRIKSNFHVNRGSIIPHLSTYCHNRLDIHWSHVFSGDLCMVFPKIPKMQHQIMNIKIFITFFFFKGVWPKICLFSYEMDLWSSDIQRYSIHSHIKQW